MADVRSDDLIFSNVSVEESLVTRDKLTQIVYKITVEGDVRSLTVLDSFKSAVGDWEVLDVDGYSLSVDESLQGRNSLTGIFPYTLEFSLEPESKAPAATEVIHEF